MQKLKVPGHTPSGRTYQLMNLASSYAMEIIIHVSWQLCCVLFSNIEDLKLLVNQMEDMKIKGRWLLLSG